MAERIFRLFSLGFLSIGFLVGVAGADKNGTKDLFTATGELIDHVSVAREANSINSDRTQFAKVGLTALPAPSVIVAAPSQKEVKTDSQNLPTPTN